MSTSRECNTTTVLAEDEPKLALTLELYLRHDGYHTERAANGRRALEMFRAAQPALVLLDIMLPEVDGLEVLKQIRSHGPSSTGRTSPLMAGRRATRRRASCQGLWLR